MVFLMPFDSSWEKLKRADEQILNLNGEVTGFLNAPPGGVYRLINDVDAQTFEEGRQAAQQRPVPQRFSVLAGEVLYNLRSALDHVAYRLVEIAGNTPTYRTAFPIVTEDPDSSSQEATRFHAAVDGMSARAQAVLRALQPHTDPDVPVEMHPLVVLRNLCNRDKHRHLNLLIQFVRRRRRIAVLPRIPKLHADGTPTGETERMEVEVWREIATDISIQDTRPPVFNVRRGGHVYALGDIRTIDELHRLPAFLTPTLTELAEQTRYIVGMVSKVFPRG